MERSSREEFVLIGAGLPRTGTMSTMTALIKLLKGDVYHMHSVLSGRPEHHAFWWKTREAGGASADEWKRILSDYRGGVDYPVSLYWKQLMHVYPHAKVLLNVRDPVKWYQSVKNSIYRLNETTAAWPCSWFLSVVGRGSTIALVKALSETVPPCSSSGLSMFGAVAAGQHAAVQFYHDHVNEVKSVVPADRLLVWEVKEGWEPLCKLLDVPVPEEPFPRLNDTEEMDSRRRAVQKMSWLMIVFAPASLLIAAWYFAFNTPAPYLYMAGGYFGLLVLMRFAAKLAFSKSGFQALGKQKIM